MKWTIGRKLNALTALSALTIVIMTALFVIVGLLVEDRLLESDERNLDMAIAERLLLNVSEINLVAMDAIVDRAEGRIADDRIGTVQQAAADFESGLDDLLKHAVDDEERALLASIRANAAQLAALVLNDLNAAVNDVGSIESGFADLDDRIDGLGGEIGEKLDQLSERLERQVGGTTLAELRTRFSRIGQAGSEINLIAMDAIIDRIEGQISPERVAEVAAQLAIAKDELNAIARADGSLQVQQEVEVLNEMFDRFVALVTSDLAGVIERFGRGEQEFARLDDAIDGAGSAAQEDLAKRIEALREKSDEASESTRGLLTLLIWASAIGGGAMVVVVAVLTSAVGSSISRALNRFAGVMRDLAGGNLDVEVPGRDRSDEIADMAAALEIFKENAVQIHNRQVAEQRAGEEIDAVVGAAVVGDFSARVEVAGKEGFMLSLSQSMNELVETVDRGLNEVMDVASALSEGDLDSRVTGDYQGSFLKLKEDLNGMAVRLADLVGDIRGATDNVNEASGELGRGADDLAQRTEQQAANLEETAAAMEEMTGTVRRNAENAKEANNLVSQARQEADHGGEIVTNAVAAMSQIEESSRSISEIVNVIDDISFQTNLLALNASVEAARAGEAGKGFAVVASEVRSLAQRSGDAASEIKQLITTSSSHVDNGVKLVNSAGEALGQIIAGVQKVASIIDEVARASEEQAGGLSEVNSAIAQMDSMTQQNAALVEQTTAAVQALGGQASELVSLMRFFRVSTATQLTGRADPKALPDHS
ncbi:MAG: methyl-accepting chemotaxis protein [Alphaproteobacteria bacterium]